MSETSLKKIEITEKKKAIRKDILAKRSRLDKAEVLKRSRLICENITSSDLYRQCDRLCLYMPIRNEVDVRLLVEPARAAGKSVYLPKVIKNSANVCATNDIIVPGGGCLENSFGELFEDYMEFYSYKEDTALVEGAYNIQEPDSDEVLIPDDKTLIIMPGAVFSKNNERIGYGGGYYDRFLELHPECKTIAVAYGFQVLDELPSEEHDICPDIVVSENVINCLS